ncbi:MAG: serine/threonine-protein kinase [Gemmataceae bacterium]
MPTDTPADSSFPEPTVNPDRSGFPLPPDGAPIVPGYRITDEIAKGGMGRVYAAHDVKLDREVAIKTLLPGANAARFVTESKITAKLPHPNIPPVHELGELADGSPFLAMKLVRGATLADQLLDRPDPEFDRPRFIQIFEGIAQAVGFAHSRGIIHRDLKPLNVMVGEFGEVQVMDWGLARVIAAVAAPETETRAAETGAARSDLTQTGTILGTPGYMAPEQARGESVDARADVFSLGSLLAAILTGKPAFVGTSAMDTVQKAAAAALTDVLARLDACQADAEVVALAKRCLSAERENRPADGRAVADEVRAYRAGVEARLKLAEIDRAKAETMLVEQRKRRRVQIRLGALAASLLVIGIAATAWQWQRAVAQEAAMAAALADKSAEYDRAEANLKERNEERVRSVASLRKLTDEVVVENISRKPELTDEDRRFLKEVLGLWQQVADARGEGLRRWSCGLKARCGLGWCDSGSGSSQRP